MKTTNTILLFLCLSAVLFAQSDSTSTDTLLAIEIADTTIISNDVIPGADSIDVDLSLDSTRTDSSEFAISDTVINLEPEMAWIPKEPDPVSIAGLMNQGPLYYWSNDGIDMIDFKSLHYVTIIDPAIIAAKANDCMDIVCHLLATDSTGVDYVIVTSDDSSDIRVYDTQTKVIVLEVPADSLIAAFNAYFQDMAGMEYLIVEETEVPFIGPVLPEGLPQEERAYNRRELALKIKRIQFRTTESLVGNPANLGRDFNTFTSWNFVPDFKFSVYNSLLTPGWYKEWWTRGGVWDEATKNEYLSTITDQNMTFNISSTIQSFGFRIWRIGVNVSARSHLKMVLPGNLLGLPMQDILLNDPLENAGLEIEAIPMMTQASISYAHPLSTPFGDIKLGIALNNYFAAGYMRMISDDFTVLLSEDSIRISASGEGWATPAGIEGKVDNLNTDNLDAASTFSDPSFGIDLGMIMDLEPLTHQELEVQVSLKNIGAQYKWSGLTHETWTLEQVMPAPGNIESDSIEQYQVTETRIISTNETLSIDVPTVLNITAFYQPLSKILIGAGIEKAFISEERLGYSSNLALNYQVNLYATSWLDFNYSKQNQYGAPVHSFGSGLHFGFVDVSLNLAFFNGLNTNAKGIGFGLSSSLHF